MTPDSVQRSLPIRAGNVRCALVALITALATVSPLLSARASAAVGPTFSITPERNSPYFVFAGRLGGQLRGKVRVVNVSTVTGTVGLYAVDASTGQTSGAVYQSAGTPSHDVGAWIHLARTQLRLGPQRSAVVPFTVAIPSSARPGQHLGGLVAKPMQLRSTSVVQKGKHAFHVNIEQIAIVAVQVDLPGGSQRMAITSLSAAGRPGYQTLLIGLSNNGEALVKGRGKLTVANAGGRSVLDQRFALDTIVPRTQIQFPVYVRQPHLPTGNYRGTVTVVYGDNHRLQRTFAFSISAQQVRQTFGSNPASVTGRRSAGSSSIPVWALALGALALVGLSVGGSALVFRSRRSDLDDHAGAETRINS